MLAIGSGVCLAASTAVVTGVVRDGQGVAQMGAAVEVLAAGSVSVATAFTDMYGRYRIGNLMPGKYQVRATAALFVPATRANLKLSTGMRATVNLTLNMLSDPSAWLPANRRKPDEPGDDWSWTLRSAANRPMLRMLGDGEVVLVSGVGPEGPRRAPAQARASLLSGSGAFGEAGLHNVIALDRRGNDGSDMVLRTDVGVPVAGEAPSTEVNAGYQKKTFAGASRLVVSYASHPEITSGHPGSGLQALRMASAEKMQLGDAVDVEAGATVYAIHTSGETLSSQPFLRVVIHPGEVWAVRYSLAKARGLQGFDDLDSTASDLPVAVTIERDHVMKTGLAECPRSAQKGSASLHRRTARSFRTNP